MSCYDEMHGWRETADVRAVYEPVNAWLQQTPPELLEARRRQAEILFRRIGITFAVYGAEEATERLIPFDIVPRVISQGEWAHLERGLRQRVQALNAFLADLYGPQECLRAGIVPADLIWRNPHFRLEAVKRPPPHGVYIHVAGIDVVRTGENDFHVLEDNVRTPSGVSYMLENREAMLRLFPELLTEQRVAPVETYIDSLLATLKSVAPGATRGDPNIALLTPGPYNSAFYEHSFLADKLGVELVEGTDLFVRDGTVFMRCTDGPKRVDVIYRRVDDDFLDPLVFRPDSALGVPGLIGAYEAGNVAIANAPGTGVADDKAVYSYMPELVRFFTGADPILQNVPTWRCREPESLAYVLEHLAELVVKEVNGSGGYGMLVGPASSKADIETFRRKLKRADLRPFVLTGADEVRITPGGLTRVALKSGSLVVNSSQGGGTKDTWVLAD